MFEKTIKEVKDALNFILYRYNFVLILIFFGLTPWIGWWGVILGVVVPASIRIYYGFDNLLWSLRSVETRMFGKPLDKELWRKGELNEYRKQKRHNKRERKRSQARIESDGLEH